MATYEDELRTRVEDLELKQTMLDQAMEAKRRILRRFPEVLEGTMAMEAYDTLYKAAMDVIARVVRDIADEIRELNSFERRTRFERWGQWWNLWIFGWIAAGLAGLLELLWELLQELLRNLNNPEKVAELLERIINGIRNRI